MSLIDHAGYLRDLEHKDDDDQKKDRSRSRTKDPLLSPSSAGGRRGRSRAPGSAPPTAPSPSKIQQHQEAQKNSRGRDGGIPSSAASGNKRPRIDPPMFPPQDVTSGGDEDQHDFQDRLQSAAQRRLANIRERREKRRKLSKKEEAPQEASRSGLRSGAVRNDPQPASPQNSPSPPQRFSRGLSAPASSSEESSPRMESSSQAKKKRLRSPSAAAKDKKAAKHPPTREEAAGPSSEPHPGPSASKPPPAGPSSAAAGPSSSQAQLDPRLMAVLQNTPPEAVDGVLQLIQVFGNHPGLAQTLSGFGAGSSGQQTAHQDEASGSGSAQSTSGGKTASSNSKKITARKRK